MEIYATKGIEYVFVVGVLAIFLGYWFWFLAPSMREAGRRVTQVAADILSWFHIPHNLYYHQGHMWARCLRTPHTVRVGLDDFASKLIGPVEHMQGLTLGQTIRQGDKMISLCTGDVTLGILAPVSGRIVRINREVLGQPTLVSESPYDKGWVCEVESNNLNRDLCGLLTGGLVHHWMTSVAQRLQTAIRENETCTVLQDGGMPVAGIARALKPVGWETFVREYLLTEGTSVFKQEAKSHLQAPSHLTVPENELECVWVGAGVVPYKLCNHNLDCDHCPFNLAMKEDQRNSDLPV